MEPSAARSGGVLAMLAAGQFVMTLDSTVMNVSLVQVADDVGTDLTGVQTAITLYTLVMASLMITGGTLGRILGHRRAFVIGSIIYGCGSVITALSQNLPMLLFGWSVLEGVGAALILPAVVALVASNFDQSDRPKAYGMVAAAGAMAAAAGPLIGGVFTTYLSWRWVFVGEAAVIVVIVVLSRRITSTPGDTSVRLDLVGTVLSVVGLGLSVYGVLRSGTWGFVRPTAGAPSWFGVSMAAWLVLGGVAVLGVFLSWQRRLGARGGEPLVDPDLLDEPQLRSGLSTFAVQFLLMSGAFYLISVFLSVAVGLSPIGTGVRLLPLSIGLLVTALGVPRLASDVSPRLTVRVGFVSVLGGMVLLVVLLGAAGTEAWVVAGPLLLIGLGIGAIASQLASVTVAAVDEARSAEVGGLQNTATNLGSSVATALAGAVLVAGLTSALFTGLTSNPDVPPSVIEAARIDLVAGAPFVSDDDLRAALAATDLGPGTVEAIITENEDARVRALQGALLVLLLVGSLAALSTARLPTRQPGQVDDGDLRPAAAT
jgi:MFS family permease